MSIRLLSAFLGILIASHLWARGFEGAAAQSGKIDPVVLQAMSSGDPVPVLLLGARQLLEGPEALQKFATTNAHRKRAEIRAEVIGRLKQIADAEQPGILKALGSAAGATRLWLVNAIAVNLLPAQIEQAAALEAVRYVYSGENSPRPIGAPGLIRTVLVPSPRLPLRVEGRKIDWNLRAIGALEAWEKLGVTGEGAVIAMLDLGVDYTHEDLRSNIWINTDEIPNNGADDDGNGYPDDYYGFDFQRMRAEIGSFVRREHHGTYTSGIAVGDGTGGTITGVAPRARLMPLIFSGSAHTSILAHQYALENGADVVNMSFSIPDLGNLRGVWRWMADHAVAAGLVLVSGAGNFQQTQPLPIQQRTPEDIPSVISVGGVDRNLNLTFFSSMGPVEWGSVRFFNDFPLPPGLIKPDVSAFPGSGYAVLDPSGRGYIDPNSGLMGNSFSSPHISGIAALMLSAAPELPAWRVKEILELTATDLLDPGKDTSTGSGLANAFEAVKTAISEARNRP